MSNMHDNITKLLEIIVKYTIIITAATYLVGFIYVSGITTNASLNLQILGADLQSSIPFSSKFIFIQGTYIIIRWLVVLLTFIFFTNCISNLKLEYGKNSTINFLYRMVFNKRYANYFIIFIIIMTCIYWSFTFLTFTSEIISLKRAFYYINLFINKIVIPIVFALTLINLNRIYKSESIKENIHAMSERNYSLTGLFQVSHLKLNFSIFLITISILLYIFFDGLLLFVHASNKFDLKMAGYNMSTVYDSSTNKKDSYYTLEVNNNHFIGFDINKSCITIIPMSDSKKVELWSLNKSNPHVKYINENSLRNYLLSKEIENPDDYLAMTSLITDIYNYRVNISPENTKSYISLLSQNYYKSSLKLISPELLFQYWKETSSFYNKNNSNYIGIDFSIPEKDKKNHNKYYIYIRELWKDKIDYLKYTIITENGSWKVDAVSTELSEFEFTLN